MLNTIGAVLRTISTVLVSSRNAARAICIPGNLSPMRVLATVIQLPKSTSPTDQRSPVMHNYPPASRGNADLIPVRTNWTAMAMSSIPIKRFIARYSRWPTFDMI